MLKHIICAIFGHKKGLNGQQYETVRRYRVDGIVSNERHLMEREWCIRCRNELSAEIIR